MTLRGSVLEDAIPSTAKHGTARGLPLKEVLEHLVPELNVQCLRLAFNTPKVTEQLLKFDEQGVCTSMYGLKPLYSCLFHWLNEKVTFGNMLHMYVRYKI